VTEVDQETAKLLGEWIDAIDRETRLFFLREEHQAVWAEVETKPEVGSEEFPWD
jgi:hypothetical protein